MIDEFAKDTPSELELLATALYVYLNVKDIKMLAEKILFCYKEEMNDIVMASCKVRGV